MIDSLNCIILCGGAGKRMGSSDTHKVCFNIGMRPAIKVATENYRKAGIKKFIVVLGHMCEQVIETVGADSPETFFVYQSNPRGTGHAAKIGVGALKNAGIEGPVMVTMGDKIVQPWVLQRLMEDFVSSDDPAVSFAVLPRRCSENAGRVVSCGGVTAIRETADIKKAMERGQDGYIEVGGRKLDPSEVEDGADCVNASVYIFDQDVLARSLATVSRDNAQSEEYLTDVIEVISRERKLSPVLFEETDAIMSYNNPKELLEIRDYYSGRMKTAPRGPSEIKGVKEWLGLFKKMPPAFEKTLTGVYGEDRNYIEQRRGKIIGALELFRGRYGGDRCAMITRAPGRINLMGRHVDHRGGNVNVMSINREVVMVASPRGDDRIRVVNTEAGFKPFEFTISDHLKETAWDNWLGYVKSDHVRQTVQQQRGHWGNYVKAAVLRLQYMCPDIKLKGMDVAVTGDIPVAAGLSSSSAVVVAATEAMVGLNGLEVSAERLVELCGEGEWFVGSRGGCADHAAMKFARRGQVVSMSFHPFEVVGKNRFPDAYRLIIVNSGLQATKSDEARNQFNHRVACYELGMLQLGRYYQIEHLRDFTPSRMDLSLASVYSSLLKLPETLRKSDLYDYFPESLHPRIDGIIGTHSGFRRYPVRSVVLYGMSECERAAKCMELLENGDMDALGRYMRVSHDGDRVAKWNGEEYVSNDFRVSDRYLNWLVDNSEDDRAKLEMQHGGYFCSTPEIDYIVDLAQSVPGVCGAQLSGAGLGGCAMILARRKSAEEVVDVITEKYYRSRNIGADIVICVPVGGAGALACVP